jgi:phosphatidylcholine synthase
VLVFVPLRYLYPSRTVPFMPLTLFLASAWAVFMLLMIWWIDAPPAWVRWPALVFPMYYIGLSLWLDRRNIPASTTRGGNRSGSRL